MHIEIKYLMDQSRVGFGTSGARGLASDITDLVAYSYTLAFLNHLKHSGDFGTQCSSVALGGDLRPSTERIVAACAKAVADMGLTPIDCGKVPSPALAYYGLREAVPAIMVTGSHIPEDRNGIKFTKPTGEISKDDEAAIKGLALELKDGLFDPNGRLLERVESVASNEAARFYVDRYLAVFPEELLSGKRLGLYEHSSVGRDLLAEIYSALGAELVRFGRSDSFVPVDTEAVRKEDCLLARQWAEKKSLDAVVSTDGDSDRPLLGDEHGEWLRGDILGILTASYLQADAVAAPVSCNTALEKSRLFKRVLRTRIGSPYVIAGMEQLRREGFGKVVGYEANGGFLLASDVEIRGRTLAALPTRDAVLVHLSVLALSLERNVTLSALLNTLPRRFTASNLLRNFDRDKSNAILELLSDLVQGRKYGEFQRLLPDPASPLAHVDRTDGLRMTFANDEIVHLRPSGNAPEFRCYAEANDDVRASVLVKSALNAVKQMSDLR